MIGSTVQSILVGATCAKIVGSCSTMDCKGYCRKLTISGDSHCRYYNLCTCFFNLSLPPKIQGIPMCSLGYGLCDANCDSNCCDAKCTSAERVYKNPYGKCTNMANKNYCICYYDHPWIAPNPYKLK